MVSGRATDAPTVPARATKSGVLTMSLSHVPRLKDVAKAANVSLAAASRILRGDKERFGEETCRRVLEASRELGWRRNLLVNGMQTGRTRTIGVMIPPFDFIHASVALANGPR